MDGGESTVAQGTEPGHSQSDLARCPCRGPLAGQRGRSHHEARQGGGVGLGDRERCGDGLTAAQHGRHITEPRDFVQLVADEDHGTAVVGHVSEHPTELVGLFGREYGGRLVEDEDPGIAPQGLEDLDALPLPHRQLPDRAVRLGGEAEAAGQFVDTGLHFLATQDALGGTEDHVLSDGERRDQAELLVDHPDTRRQCIGRGVEAVQDPVEAHLPLVGPVHAGQHVHQRGLARPVLAEDGVDGSPVDPQVGAGVGDDTGEPLPDVDQFDGGGLGHGESSRISRRPDAREGEGGPLLTDRVGRVLVKLFYPSVPMAPWTKNSMPSMAPSSRASPAATAS